LIEEAALIEALRSGPIGHAGLDVFHAEPLAPDHPLARMENVPPHTPPSARWKPP
jgi:phosphoglycerate dehydrogenase-like enzyme